jgi:hypothetical protein
MGTRRSRIRSHRGGRRHPARHKRPPPALARESVDHSRAGGMIAPIQGVWS